MFLHLAIQLVYIGHLSSELHTWMRGTHFILINNINYKKYHFNPLVPSAHKSVRISKISILKLEGIIKKISYESRDYESVDEKGLS